jgi:hypothetical protein
MYTSVDHRGALTTQALALLVCLGAGGHVHVQAQSRTDLMSRLERKKKRT